jgi:hypothetical protein
MRMCTLLLLTFMLVLVLVIDETEHEHEGRLTKRSASLMLPLFITRPPGILL